MPMPVQPSPAANRGAAAELGIAVDVFEARIPDQVESALARMASQRPDAIYIPLDPVVAARFADIAAFALSRKWLSIGTITQFVEAGGALCYGPNAAEMAQRTAGLIDRVLRGAKPAELPVE